MIGAIAGDIIGSTRENFRIKRKDFDLFTRFSTYTDDTVLTVAVADAMMSDRDYARTIKRYARRHPMRGYGPRFALWMMSSSMAPYHSFGNGSAMRVSPVGYGFDDADTVAEEARRTAVCTHDHPEGIRGAQAVAMAVFLARQGHPREAVRERLEAWTGYDLSRHLAEIRPTYQFDVTCQGSVPEALIAFLEADSFEDAIRNAVSLGGDADTQACIAGAVAEAYFKEVPERIVQEVHRRLPAGFRQVISAFYQRYGIPETGKHWFALEPPPPPSR